MGTLTCCSAAIVVDRIGCFVIHINDQGADGTESGGEEIIDFQIQRTRPMWPYRTSGLIDFVEGREVEVDAIWREPLRRAQAAGVSAPHLGKLLAGIEQRLARA